MILPLTIIFKVVILWFSDIRSIIYSVTK